MHRIKNRYALVVGLIALFVAGYLYAQVVPPPIKSKKFLAGDGTDTYMGALEQNDGGAIPSYIGFLTASAGIQTYCGDNSSTCDFDVGTNSDVLSIGWSNIQMNQSFTATASGVFSGSPGLTTNDIGERSVGSGVTIDGVLLKDSLMLGTYLDIDSLTADATPDGAADYVITYDATASGNKKVLLNNLPAGGGGESNTASNQGTDGVGVYDTKAGVDLQFRHVAPGSTKISTTLNSKDIDIDADTTVLWNFVADGGGDLTEYDLEVGDTTTPDYGILRIGNSIIGRTSHTAADGAPSYNINGTFVFQNPTGPVTGDIEFGFLDSTGLLRFALPKSAVGNATYNPRSMLIAGPAIADSDIVTVTHWQGEGIFDNLACDTSGDGADLGVQNDLEVEGDVFADSILESTTASGVTIDGVLLKDGVVDDSDVTINADHIDTLTDIAAALKSGSDATLITGTEGTDGNCAKWDANGDLVDHGSACGGGSSVEIKSGKITTPSEGTLNTHTFGTAFSTTPHVVITMCSPLASTLDEIWVEQITTTAFKYQYNLKTSVDEDVCWIATSAGDP